MLILSVEILHFDQFEKKGYILWGKNEKKKKNYGKIERKVYRNFSSQANQTEHTKKKSNRIILLYKYNSFISKVFFLYVLFLLK
jgi:hypothetical protein